MALNRFSEILILTSISLLLVYWTSSTTNCIQKSTGNQMLPIDGLLTVEGPLTFHRPLTVKGTLPGDVPVPVEEPLSDDGPLPVDEPLPADEPLLVEGLLPVDRPLPDDEPLPDNELLPVEGLLPVGGRGVQKQRFPTVIIIGAGKCGTHALIDMLSMHPQIVEAPYELAYFSKSSFYEEGVEAYREKMPYTYEDQITIEKSPQYLKSHEAPYRIHEYNATIKLILIVKEPVTRLLSGYAQVKVQIGLGMNHHLYGKKLDPFEDLVIGPDGEVIETDIVTDSIYWPPLKHYLEVFPREQILVVDGDALVEKPFPVVENVVKFLKLGRKITAENFYFSERKGFWCMHSESKSGCLGAGKGRKHEEVKPEVIDKLRKFYKPHNEQFYDISGINFNWPS